MFNKVFLIAILAALSLRCGSIPPNRSGITRNKLLLILLDGARFDYVTRQTENDLPGFYRFLQNGVQAEWLTPVFPTLSYPVWTTLVTGLWVESHGIVGNYFYDPYDNTTYFSLDDKDATGRRKWWTAEPIWITAKKANLTVGAYLWSRCDVAFNGVTIDYCEPYYDTRGSQKFVTDIEKALNDLQKGYDFALVYTPHLDNVGHASGPDSDELKQELQAVDRTIGYMQDRLDQIGLTDSVNIIIVSDHGMTPTGPGTVREVELDDYLLTHYVDFIGDRGAFCNIKVKQGYVDQVYDRLKAMPGVKAYRHDEIPEELHFKNNSYIYDIILKADINTVILPSRSPYQLPPRIQANATGVQMGSQGYDPTERNMRAIFYAKGPDFKVNQRVPAIRSVDIYSLLARLLQVEPLPNNGTIDNVKQILKYPEAIPTTPVPKYYSTGTTMMVVPILLFAVIPLCIITS